MENAIKDQQKIFVYVFYNLMCFWFYIFDINMLVPCQSALLLLR